MSESLDPAAEAPLGRAYDGRLLGRLIGWLRPYRLDVGLAVVVLLAASALELLQPYLIKLAIDGSIARGDLAALPPLAAAFGAVLLAVFALRYLEDYLASRLGQLAAFDLRVALFRHVQTLSIRYFDRTPVGRLMTRVIGDVDALNEMFTSGVVAVFGDLFVLAGIITAMLLLDARLALVVLAVVPAIALATQLFRVQVREAFRAVRGKLARVNSFLQEALSGMAVLQLHRRERVDRERFDRLNAEHRDAHLRTVLCHAVFYPVVEVLGALAAGLLLWRGGLLALEGAVSLGVLVAFLQYAKRFFQPIMDLSEKYNILQSAMAASERIFEVLDARPDVVAPPAPATLPAGRVELELDRVWFAYQEPHWVLRDVSLRVPAGTMVAVVGATGSGKSTLASLLLRLHDPGRGVVRVGGVDLRGVDPRALRRRVGFVPQDVFLFSGSLLDNIRLGEDLPPDRIEAVLDAAGLRPLLARLPDGVRSDVRERGGALSQGERQLVALARALAFDPDVLVLDEATASVDSVTEERVQQAIARLARDRTSLVIAHRLSTVRDAHAIAVLHKGELREWGSHDELLRRNGLYRRLYDLQFAPGRGERQAALAGPGRP